MLFSLVTSILRDKLPAADLLFFDLFFGVKVRIRRSMFATKESGNCAPMACSWALKCW